MKELDEKDRAFVEALTGKDVMSVYVGRVRRCCCGCSGKHTTNPVYRALRGEDRGYTVDDDECDEMSKIAVNWEKVAEGLAAEIQKSLEFGNFCNEFASDFEDKLRQKIREQFIDPYEKDFNPSDDDVMEFVLTMEGDLSAAFFKRFVTDYLGRKW